MLARHEGRKNKVYKCPAGYNTIGVGWNIDANPLPMGIAEFLRVNGFITDDMIEDLLDISIDVATKNCKRLYPNFSKLSVTRQNALIDFMFNVGIGTAAGFHNTNLAINEGRWEDAAKGLRKSLYWRQLGGDPEGTDDGKLERPEEIAQMLIEG